MNLTCSRYEGVLFLFVIFIPWPGPMIIREPCPRDKAALVRKVVLKRWMPILEKVGATLPLECPLNPLRDIFHPQESKKLRDDPQWSCGFCGKSFYREEQLDAHMEKRHSTEVNGNDDSTCLADFCDIMRCEVLQEKLREIEEETPSGKEVKFWNQQMISSSKKSSTSDKAIQPAIPQSVMRTYQPWPEHSIHNQHFAKPVLPTNINPPTPRNQAHIASSEDVEPGEVKKSQSQQSCGENDGKDCSDKDELHNDSEKNAGRNEVPIHLFNSWKDTCSDENLAELRAKCQVVITQCISGLVLNLTLDQVKSIEMALQKTVCWYLTCDRYWESGVFEPPEFPWGVVCALVFILTFGLSIVYYIVWVFFESNPDSTANTPVTTEALPIVPSETAEVAVYKRRPQSTTGGSASRTSSLGRHSTSMSRARFNATESENECRDSGFNEGGLFPELAELQGGYSDYEQPTAARLRHYSEDSRVSAPLEEASRYYVPEERMYNYASTFTPNYEQRRLKRNKYNYLDDFDTYSEFDTEEAIDSNSLSKERNDSFIYVSYPPEMKKKFMENR